MLESVSSTPLNMMFFKYPYLEDFFVSLGLHDYRTTQTCEEYVYQLDDNHLEDLGLDRQQIISDFNLFIQKMEEIRKKSQESVKSVTIIGGYDKNGNKENILTTMNAGEVISIVGPIGSGKSRLLADIECLAQRDTPTGRQILINQTIPDEDMRFALEHKLVAQLSQNMNFIIDLTVGEFVTMHAESRMIEKVEEIVHLVFSCANELAGEQFSIDLPVTSLSGGQSRALMIADTALLSSSPIVLIDEIENAGVDRKKSLELLVKGEKIILITTHDPLLALLGNRRIVIKNGGINKVIETSVEERAYLVKLQVVDTKISLLRNLLRAGETLYQSGIL